MMVQPKLDYWIVYAFQCPRWLDLHYAGKSNEDPKHRLSRLIMDSKKGRHPKRKLHNWVRSLLADGLEPRIVVLGKYDSDEEARVAEVEWMEKLRVGKADLLNVRPGGLRDATGVPKPEGMGERVSERQRGRSPSPELKARQAEGQKTARRK